METEIPQNDENDTMPAELDWEQRVLCSDGNCIGVIGPDGRCKECGKPHDGSVPEPRFSETEETEPPAAETGPEREEEPAEKPAREAGGRDDWQDRVLCSDGNCIGVVGPDGRCKECGKPYERPE